MGNAPEISHEVLAIIITTQTSIPSYSIFMTGTNASGTALMFVILFSFIKRSWKDAKKSVLSMCLGAISKVSISAPEAPQKSKVGI